MDEKERILKLVSDKTITVQEGLALLEKLGPEATGIIVPIRKKEKEETAQEMIDRLVENTINDLQTVHNPEEDKFSELDHIEDIARIIKMTYSDKDFKSEEVTREKLLKVAKCVVRYAIENLLEKAAKSEKPEYEEGCCATGRFEAHAWFDDNEIEVELKFVPFTAFGCGSECEVIPEILLEKYKTK